MRNFVFKKAYNSFTVHCVRSLSQPRCIDNDEHANDLSFGYKHEMYYIPTAQLGDKSNDFSNSPFVNILLFRICTFSGENEQCIRCINMPAPQKCILGGATIYEHIRNRGPTIACMLCESNGEHNTALRACTQLIIYYYFLRSTFPTFCTWKNKHINISYAIECVFPVETSADEIRRLHRGINIAHKLLLFKHIGTDTPKKRFIPQSCRCLHAEHVTQGQCRCSVYGANDDETSHQHQHKQTFIYIIFEFEIYGWQRSEFNVGTNGSCGVFGGDD